MRRRCLLPIRTIRLRLAEERDVAFASQRSLLGRGARLASLCRRPASYGVVISILERELSRTGLKQVKGTSRSRRTAVTLAWRAGIGSRDGCYREANVKAVDHTGVIGVSPVSR